MLNVSFYSVSDITSVTNKYMYAWKLTYSKYYLELPQFQGQGFSLVVHSP